jgi:lysophospholipase
MTGKAAMEEQARADDQQQFRSKYETRVKPFYQRGRFGEFPGVGSSKIRYVCFESGRESGALVVLPGKSETYLKYAELFYDLQELRLSIYAFDHRGMGFSERLLPDRLKVHVEEFRHYLEDVELFLDDVVRARERGKLFVLGHSMGGLVAALHLERRPADFQAAVLSSPMFEIDTGRLPGFLARLIAGPLERLKGPTGYGPGQDKLRRPEFAGNRLTHSYPRWFLWERETIPNTPELHFGGVTNRWLRESLRYGRKAVLGAGKISVPVLLLQAEQDSITRAGGQDCFCRRAPLCRKELIRGARHEILIEQEEMRRQALEHIKGFLIEQIKGR